MIDQKIPVKANRVINIILIGFLLILVRVWYLGVVQHEHHLEMARKPTRRVVVESVERGTIRDRFNIPMAVNKIRYDATVSFAQIRQLPNVRWQKDAAGKWVRQNARMAYISDLSQMLGRELRMDPISIEDTILGKACLFPHTPFVIKEDLSEQEYCRLKLLEKDWIGVQAKRSSKRFYPLGKVGCDVLGYLGPISQKEYVAIAQEIDLLQTYLGEREMGELIPLPPGYSSPLEVRRRLKELQEKSYTINDLVGKSGVEASFDEQLRGFCGKKMVEVDVKGNFIGELPGSRKPKNGDRILLTISSELQAFAESLLAEHEPLRDHKSDGELKLDSPWIKGGAIVALDPKTGEVLALASYPRFDPNDFVPTSDPESRQSKEKERIHWLENESYAGEIWDGKRPLEREIYAKQNYSEETLPLNWDRYLELILPPEGSLQRGVEKVTDIKTATLLQESLRALLHLSAQDDVALLVNALYEREGDIPSRLSTTDETLEAIRVRCQEKPEPFSKHKKQLDQFLSPITYNDDKLLLLDLIKLVVKQEDFDEELLKKVGHESLGSYRAICQSALSIESLLRPHMQELFYDLDFTSWRKSHFKEFLKKKRQEEKESKRYTRPYTEYLDKLFRVSFKRFWQNNRCLFIHAFLTGSAPASLHDRFQPYFAQILELCKTREQTDSRLKQILSTLDFPLALKFLRSIHPFHELTQPLYGQYRSVRQVEGRHLEKHLAAAFYPLYGFSYARSQAFRQASPQGSVFKLVTGYEALKQRHTRSPHHLNPLSISDLKGGSQVTSNKQIMGYTQDGHAITRLYKGGLVPRSSHSNIGQIDIIGALEQSSNIYFALLAAEQIAEPLQLSAAARGFSFGAKTGIELPGEVAGNVPDDVAYSRTSLYSFGIGQHSLVVTPLQTALMTSAIANKGKVLRPQIVKAVAGKESLQKSLLFDAPTFALQEELGLVGISFPLFLATHKEQLASFVTSAPTEVKNSVSIPDPVRNMLLEGMNKAVAGARGTARANAIHSLVANPKLMREYVDTQKHFVGKTGTAEILYKHTLDRESEAQKVTHVWFTGISFADENKTWKDPELVVVVLLRFGERGGKEGAPLAMQMFKKWREILAAHKN